MAFGLGFDKAKILQTAEKYVVQGKMDAAIGEYRKILKKDPKDLMTLNTVGDLYARSGRTEDALHCFYELAEKSVEAGFVPRAIAVYKRITKIDPQAMQALTKLGELYSMQGLMRDARTHYLQAVEIYMRRRDMAKARETFEKVLLLDMDNPRLQRRMAELYAETGKPAEAVATYLSAAERFLDANEAAEANKALEALLNLDPRNVEAKTLRGRMYLQQGNADKAVETLQSLPSLGSHKGALNTLFHAYRQRGDAERANQIAAQLFDQHEDFAGLALVSEDLLGQGSAEQAFAIYQQAAPRLQKQGAYSVLIEGLRKIHALDSANVAVLELLWSVYRQAGDIGEGRETAELLGHAYVAGGELEKARDVYAELVAVEPDNAEHRRLLRQVESRLVGGRKEEEQVIPEAAPLMAMEVAAPEEEQATRMETLPPREQVIVKNCITESELYITYHQIPKAIVTLENGLVEVPGNLTLYEQLLPLYEQTQQYQKAAQCAEALTEAYVKMGDGERAIRYGELIVGYQQKVLEMGTAPASGAPPAPEVEGPKAASVPAAPAEQSQVREIDLSMEWAALSETGASSSATTTAVESTLEEIEFYLQARLASEAAAALERLREQSPTHPGLADFQERLAALQPASPAGVETVFPQSTATPEIAATPQAEFTPPAAVEPEPELVLDEVLGAKSSVSPASSFELSLEEAPAVEAAPPSKGPQAAPPPAAGAYGAKAAAEPSKGFLDDVFAEFKDEVEESAAAGEDLETHYNMGVAFKEMALYDEAIGEFQKVHQLAEQTKDYSHVVQCCSLLATCFLEKAMPQLAVQWYQTAINSPGVDPESALALLYEIGCAYEVAGDRPAALKSFLEVYARNIDYRNVAERIRDLQQNS